MRKTASQITDEVIFKAAGVSEHFPKTLGHLQKLKEALGKKFEEKLFKTLEEKGQAIGARSAGEQDLLRRIGKNKTASQLGDEVLEKLSIDLATLRRVSSDVLRRHGIRGGMGVDLETGTAGVFRNPRRAGLTPTGPTLSPEMAMKTPTGRAPVKDMRDLLEAHPRDVYHVPAPILSGGGRGTTSDALSSPIARQQDLEAPQSPQGKEMLNRVGLLHENFERQALGRGLSVAQRGQNWGEGRLPSALKDVGMIGGGHLSPRVILREHNVLSTLPRGTARDEVLNSFVGMRALDRSWNNIHRALEHPQGLRYGEQRLSRHAIRRIEDLVRQGG